MTFTKITPDNIDPNQTNTFNSIKTDNISEDTVANGITIDGVSCKDSGISGSANASFAYCKETSARTEVFLNWIGGYAGLFDFTAARTSNLNGNSQVTNVPLNVREGETIASIHQNMYIDNTGTTSYTLELFKARRGLAEQTQIAASASITSSTNVQVNCSYVVEAGMNIWIRFTISNCNKTCYAYSTAAAIIRS